MPQSENSLEIELWSKMKSIAEEESEYALEFQFNDEIRNSDDTIAEAFYPFEGEIFILDDNGMDCPFSAYEEEDQILIHRAIMDNKYTQL